MRTLKTFLLAPSESLASVVVFLSASLWGLYWIPLRYLGKQGIEGGWATALLNLPTGLLLIPFVIWQWRQERMQFWHSVLIGFLTGLSIALYTSGLVYSSVVRATLLFFLTPAWATLIGIFWLGEKATWQRWAAIILGLAGLGILVSGGGTVPLNIGDIFALLSGIFWAAGTATIKRYNDVPLLGMTMYQFIFTALCAVALGVLMGGFQPPDLAVVLPNLTLSVAISALVILPSVWLIFWGSKFLFPGRVGLLLMSEVLVAVLTASIFLPEETMSLVAWFGALLIIAACLIEVFSEAK